MVIVLSVLATSSAIAAKEIIIGGLFALSGKASHIGIPSKDVADMVVSYINKNGGIDGAKIKLIVADTQSDPSKAAVAMKKLVTRDKVKAIVGPTTTGEAMACLKVIEQSKIPVVACVGGAAAVEPVSERYWIFKSPQKSSTAVMRIYEYLKENKMTKIGVMTATDKFGQEGKSLLDKYASKYGIKIVAKESFDPTNKDMSVQVGKIAAKKPDAMVVWTIGPAGAMVAKSAKQLNVGFKVVQCHGQPDPIYIKLAGKAAEGTIMPSTKLMVANQLHWADPQRSVVRRFIKMYKNAGHGEVSTHSGYAWDAVQLIAKAMDKVGSDPKKVRDAIEQTNGYVGVSGIYNMSKKDHCGLDTDSLVMVEVSNGKWKLLD